MHHAVMISLRTAVPYCISMDPNYVHKSMYTEIRVNESTQKKDTSNSVAFIIECRGQNNFRLQDRLPASR